MNRLVFLVSTMVLTGCTTIPDAPFQPLNSSERLTNKPIVMWEVVDDVDGHCKKLNDKIPKVLTVYGCAQPAKTWCKIYTGKTTTMATLGHELRHCFEGNWHE